MRTLFVSMLVLCAACRGPVKKPEKKEDAAVHKLEFSEERHTLYIAFHPRVEASLEWNDSTDIVMMKEAGDFFRVDGNGRRSVAFVNRGGRATFDKLLACNSAAEVHAAFPDDSPYFSPGLRDEEAVPGAVFLAHVDRGEVPNAAQVGVAKILIEEVGETFVTLRVVVGPPWW